MIAGWVQILLHSHLSILPANKVIAIDGQVFPGQLGMNFRLNFYSGANQCALGQCNCCSEETLQHSRNFLNLWDMVNVMKWPCCLSSQGATIPHCHDVNGLQILVHVGSTLTHSSTVNWILLCCYHDHKACIWAQIHLEIFCSWMATGLYCSPEQ